MNKIKIIITLALVLLVGISAGALGTRIYLQHQLEGSPSTRSRTAEDRVKKIVRGLVDDLRLNAAQTVEVEKLVAKMEARATALRVSYQPGLRKVYEEGFQRISERLTDEQRKKLQARQEKFSQRYNAYYFRSLRTAQKAIPDAAELRVRLGLDAAQESQVAAILADQRAQQAAMIDRYEKADRPDIAAVGADLAEIGKTARNRIAALLTPEQLTRY
ncbi:MAG: hypothetical protein A4E60_02285 [Syntrophorhabdus sp. PtaB.Bin047]|nr:MAG: hypothetical protein A4E60_02285 [Syntrophorhabdus sp. PtaB.Bin047]